MRDPIDNQTGYSDKDARVGRAGRSYALGYQLHLCIDHKLMLPLSCMFDSANQNEKKHSLTILEKAMQVLKGSGAKIRSLIADSQWSDGKIRLAVDKTVIPYPANQKRGVKDVLRVVKKFGSFGPEEQRKEYHESPTIEAVNSFFEGSVRHGVKQSQRLMPNCNLCIVQHFLFGSQPGSSSKLRKSGQSSFTDILQHVITGQASALCAD